MAEIGDGDLADVAGVVLEAHLAFEDAWRAIDAADVGEGDLAPVRGGRGEQFGDHFGGAPAQRQEGDAQLVQPGEVGIGGEAAVEDEFGGQLAGALAPGLGEAQDLVVLGVLAEAGVGPGEQAGVGVAGEESEDASLAAAALGDVVAFEQGVVAVEGDGVEIEIEGASAAEVRPQAAGGVVPGVHQGGAAARVDAAGVFGEGGALGDGIEAGEEGEPLVKGFGHDPRGPTDAPQLEGEQGAEGAAGRDHRAARQAVLAEHVVEPDPGEVAGKQEQATELGAQAAGGQVQGALVGDGGVHGSGSGGALCRRAPPQLGQASALEHARDSSGADRQGLLRGEVRGDLGGREIALVAQRENTLVAVRAGLRLALAAAVGEEERPVGLLQERGAQIAQGAGCVAKAAGGLLERGVVDEERAQGFVAAVGAVFGGVEALGGVLHVFMHISMNVPHYLISNQRLAVKGRWGSGSGMPVRPAGMPWRARGCLPANGWQSSAACRTLRITGFNARACLVQAEIALGGLGSECHAGNAVNAASLEGHLSRETFLENLLYPCGY